MSKIIKIFSICFVLIFLIFVGCKNQEKDVKNSYFDDGDKYLGFNDIDLSLNIQECESKNYLVIKNQDIVANREIFEKFLESSEDNNESRIRIAHFIDDNKVFYTDLIHDIDGYYFFYHDEEEMEKEPYKYLLILEGRGGIPLKDDSIVVISDEKELTYDEASKAMFSSSMEYINSVGRYRIVMFNYGDYR